MNHLTRNSQYRRIIVALLVIPIWTAFAAASEPMMETPAETKTISGSFVAFDGSMAGTQCWQPGSTQTFCFRAESFTSYWEFVENLWLLLPADWTVQGVTVSGTPSCDNGSFGSFSWSFHTPSHEINIDHQRDQNDDDHCIATYCVETTTGTGSGDALVSWYWGGENWGDPPHFPCSDDGYTPSGANACDESLQPRAVIHDCSAFGSLDGAIYDFATSGPTCTQAMAAVEPGGLTLGADPTGGYGPVFLADGTYDVTASADGYQSAQAAGVTVTAGVATTQDFDLVRPAMSVSPTGFSVIAPANSSTDRTLALGNIGIPPLDWMLRELPPGESANPLSAEPTRRPSAVKIEADLEAAMRSRGEATILIDFHERPDLSPALSMDWETRGRYVVDALRATADRAQAGVRAFLEAEGASYQAFWIDNYILVPSASRQVFDGLTAFHEIEILRADRTMMVIEPVEKTAAPAGGRAVEANITHVNADLVWGTGFDGTGMVVAGIDTGVRYTHEVLEPRYRGNLGGGSFDHDYNWLDGVDGSASAPSDDHGHGSHTVGTMVGDDGGANQVGMAPGATWIACDGCEGQSCSSSGLLTCAQWVAAPFPIGDPSSPDPSKRPHVVNNSWGDCAQSYDNWYQGVVDSWHAAGVYPVFANVNASNCGYSQPPGCNTVGNPGRYGNVTGVGSTGQSNGAYAPHSNWGPTDNHDTVNPNGYPTLKPQVVAPGVNIRSALNGSDSSYGSWGGTSMSAPHVAGLIALIWQAAPCLVADYAQTEDIIQASAVAIPYASNCGDEGPGNVPNMATGWGEIDALEAVIQASNFCDTDWLPWVSASPEDGQIPDGGSQDVTLSFDCGLLPLDNVGSLRLTSNDPCAETTVIDLALYCNSSSVIFADGFEGGTTGRWSSTTP